MLRSNLSLLGNAHAVAVKQLFRRGGHTAPIQLRREDCSPPLGWSEAPTNTRSFVLLCDDPDAPAGTCHHWAAYDIPAGRTKLGENAASTGSGFKQAINDFQRSGYGGPCPPHRHGLHHYHFRLLALSVAELSLREAKPFCIEVEREARKHVIAEATLVGLYQR